MSRLKSILFAVCLSLSLTVSFVSALSSQRVSRFATDGEVFCVVPPGESTGPFADCDEVFTSVQTAVDTAIGGEEIWVAAGIYTDTHTIDGRYHVVYIDKNLTIQGGYTPPFSSTPDPLANVTTLDAQQSGRVIYATGPISVTIEGLHLTGGRTELKESGSGLYASGGTILLQDNVIADNQLTSEWDSSGVSFGNGSGVYLANEQATLRGNNIHDNIGYGRNYGGGVAALNSVITLQHNIISSNTVGLSLVGELTSQPVSGGGLYVADSQVSITDNDIFGNTARRAESPGLPYDYGVGGGLSLERSSGLVDGNRIVNNMAGQQCSGQGGGIYIYGLSQLTLTRNLIENNVAGSYNVGVGGGIVIYTSSDGTPSITLHDNQILNNTALITGELGAGGGVALLAQQTSILTLTQNVILSNTALITGQTGLGGGLLIGSTPRLFISQNQVMSNMAAQSGNYGHGGGLYLIENKAFLEGNVIGHNHAANTGSGLFLDGGQTRMENTAVFDNQGDSTSSGLHLVCGAQLDAAHTTIARNTGNAIHFALTSDCYGLEPLAPSTAVFTNTILVSHTVGAVISANNTLAMHGVLWYGTPIAYQAEPGAHVTVTHQHPGDPLFAADGYHLTAGSAARFKGLVTGVKTDIDGQERPLINPALGADEYWLASYFLPVIRR